MGAVEPESKTHLDSGSSQKLKTSEHHKGEMTMERKTPKQCAEENRAKALSRSRFQKGSGCYTCKVCGKRTRSTGQGDNEHVRLCVNCYEKAGDENDVTDGYMTQEEFDQKWEGR
jgi:hypothetical protein